MSCGVCWHTPASRSFLFFFVFVFVLSGIVSATLKGLVLATLKFGYKTG